MTRDGQQLLGAIRTSPEYGDGVVVACGEDEAPPGGDAGDPVVVFDFGLGLRRRVAVEVADLEDALRVPPRLPLLGEEPLQPAADKVIQERELECDLVEVVNVVALPLLLQ